MLYDFYGNDIVFIKHPYSTRCVIDAYVEKNGQRIADKTGKVCKFNMYRSLSGSLYECKQTNVLNELFGETYQ